MKSNDILYDDEYVEQAPKEKAVPHSNTSDVNKYEDPIWAYTLNSRLVTYIPTVRKFWENIESIDITGTGSFEMKQVIKDAPDGMMYRVTNTPVRSPIKNVQVFPFIPTVYLQLYNVAGGMNRMISRVCLDNKFTIDEFTIIEKSNLPSTYHQGQFIAFVPTAMLNNAHLLGKWIYLTLPEISALAQGQVLPSIKLKTQKYVAS